jgi:hypothetical protein
MRHDLTRTSTVLQTVLEFVSYLRCDRPKRFCIKDDAVMRGYSTCVGASTISLRRRRSAPASLAR